MLMKQESGKTILKRKRCAQVEIMGENIQKKEQSNAKNGTRKWGTIMKRKREAQVEVMGENIQRKKNN